MTSETQRVDCLVCGSYSLDFVADAIPEVQYGPHIRIPYQCGSGHRFDVVNSQVGSRVLVSVDIHVGAACPERIEEWLEKRCSNSQQTVDFD